MDTLIECFALTGRGLKTKIPNNRTSVMDMKLTFLPTTPHPESKTN